MRLFLRKHLKKFLQKKMSTRWCQKLALYFGIHMELTITYYMVLVFFIAASVTLTLLSLIVQKPVFLEKICPGVYGRRPVHDVMRDYHGQHRLVFSCQDFWKNNSRQIKKAKNYKWCERTDLISDEAFIYQTKNCKQFQKQNGYLDFHTTEEEKNFPLAFSILMYESVEQAERLLQAIYRPQNHYCIHIDASAQTSVYTAMKAIADCLDNVFLVTRRVEVKWAMFSVLEAEIMCLKDLWKRKGWKYFLNLTGREYPLKTNKELVEILKSYKGANDVDGTPHRRPKLWTDFVWKRADWHTGKRKTPPPHGYIVHKGSTHIAVTREFVNFTLHNKTAQDLLEWMKDTRTPDEMYFNTLSHNSQLGVPGAYKGDPELKRFYTRWKWWQSETANCEGKWFRFICQLGVGDLPKLLGAKELFVNKLRIEFEPLAFECLEQWYRNRTLSESQDHFKFNVSFYENLPIVNNHV